MSEQSSQEEILRIIKEIESNPQATQRTISSHLDISLGKTNYLIKELIKKGMVEVKNFSDNPNKLQKINYFLTKKGIEHKIHLLQVYLQIKEAEYNRIKQEWDKVSEGR